MLENYLSGTVWQCFMKNKFVEEGLKKLKIEKVQDLKIPIKEY